MRDESQVWLALLRRKGLSVTELAEQLGATQQHVHELLTGRSPAETERALLEHALSLVDAAGDELPPEAIIDEIRAGLEATLRARAQAHDSALLAEVDSRLSGYTDA